MRSMAWLAIVGVACSDPGASAQPPPEPDAGGAADAAVGIVEAGASGPDSCARIPPLRDAPNIDGTLDDESLPLERIVPLGWEGRGPLPPVVTDAVFAYRPDGLYAWLRVTKPNRQPAATDEAAFCGDAVELFVDADGIVDRPDGDGTRRIVVGPTSAGRRVEIYAGDKLLTDASTSSDIAVALSTRPSGWSAEIFVRAATLGLPTWALFPPGRVGLALTVDIGQPLSSDAGACASRYGRYFWRIADVAPGACAAPECNVAAFCTPALMSR